jgi:hypothetical protein
VVVKSFKEKSEEAKRHFISLFKEPIGCSIDEMLKFLQLFPKDFTEEMNDVMEVEIIENELESTLFATWKGKIPGPDGIMVEFYIGFFEILKDVLPKVVHESKCNERILGALNSTYLVLIPKKKEDSSFEYFHPISCCNVVYKITSNIVANGLKPILR